MALVASNKSLLRFFVDLSTTEVPVGSTSDALGLVLANIPSSNGFAGAEKLRVTFGGIKAVTAIAGATSVTGLFVGLQKNGGNNVQIPSSGDLSLTVTAGATAIGTRDEELCNEIAAKIHTRFSGTSVETYKLVLFATGAATVPGTTTGLVEVVVEVEAVSAGLPRAF